MSTSLSCTSFSISWSLSLPVRGGDQPGRRAVDARGVFGAALCLCMRSLDVLPKLPRSWKPRQELAVHASPRPEGAGR
eukprot:4445160-Prymnesium_polylepis.1